MKYKDGAREIVGLGLKSFNNINEYVSSQYKIVTMGKQKDCENQITSEYTTILEFPNCSMDKPFMLTKMLCYNMYCKHVI